MFGYKGFLRTGWKEKSNGFLAIVIVQPLGHQHYRKTRLMFGLAQREQADKLATLTFICSHYEREGYFIISNLLNNTNLWAI